MKNADAAAARERLAIRGWIPARSETFRHMPPPEASVWLGTDRDGTAGDDPTTSAEGAGWTLHPLAGAAPGDVKARWLEADDEAGRRELFAGSSLPEEGESAPFAWAHRVVCRQGLHLRIDPPRDADGTSKPVWLHVRHSPRAAVEAPLLSIDVAPGCHCVLVETHDLRAGTRSAASALVQNLQAHIRVGEGATLRHVRVVAPAGADRIAHHLHASVDQGGSYRSALVASGSRYHLQRQRIELHAEDASGSVAGVLVAAASAVEQQVYVSHDAPRTTSDVETLALASGKALAVVNAHTRIAAGSDDASVKQRLSGVPTSGQPRLVMRPHLEIHHDKVQAVHGATWGALPEDALFYARQRGVDERQARQLIVEGMAVTMLERCLGDPTLLEALRDDGTLRIEAFIAEQAPTTAPAHAEPSHG